MKIFSAEQIRAADRYTIKHEPISSIDLMERASKVFVKKFLELYPEPRPVKVICGVGNNGGDGLVIARLLKKEMWNVSVYVVGDYYNGSRSFQHNLKRVENSFGTNSLFLEINSAIDFPRIEKNDIIIDAILGSGLSKPVTGVIAKLIDHLNQHPVPRVSVDIASGLGVDQLYEGAVLEPDHTISFQFPKLSFFSSGHGRHVGQWHIVDIGLSQEFIRSEQTNYYLTTLADIQHLIPKRDKYAYKNQVGALKIVAGSKGRMGAAVLCAKGAFRAGVGIMEVHTPRCGTDILQTALPEAMVEEDTMRKVISDIPASDQPMLIGPGIGQSPETTAAFKAFLKARKEPLVLDADAINILASHPFLFNRLPSDSVLTPHEGEFKRLVGDWGSNMEKVNKLSAFCKEHQVNAVLKGPNSAVCNTAGQVFFNSTGNPVLATAGSGDVLAGVVASFLAQGLKPFHALRLGVYIHGMAGDLIEEEGLGYGALASDVANFLPKAIQKTVLYSS